MADNNTPNQNANKNKSEGDPWSAEQTSATQAAENNDIAGNYEQTEGEGGGITNRGIGEEVENQQSLPDRGRSRTDQSSDTGVGNQTESDRESERSER